MNSPCIRGILLQALREKLDELVGADAISREELEVRLEARDLELLDGKTDPETWYPLGSAARIAELLADRLDCDEEALSAELGRHATQRWLQEGLFPIPVDDGANFAEMAGELLLMLPEQLLNFGRWSFSGASISEFQIDALGVGALPDPLRYALQGGFEALIHRLAGRHTRVTSARPSADHIEYRGALATAEA